ncbi:TNF receptor-associated factor 5-like [Hydra vulgaris]|uniref:TNF receptor-associated factor 5-like n=1 Tax=Hydra vulgaris TaxID=6087 RepID=A0ABM4B0R5_HYDVU
MNNNDDFKDMFPGFGDVFEETENMPIENITFNDIFKEPDIEDIETNLIYIFILLYVLLTTNKKMADNIYPCCFCDKEFSAEELLHHQTDCSTEQYSYECFTCKKKVQDLLNHECDFEFLDIQKICFFCNTKIDDQDYYEHSVICFQYYKEQQYRYLNQIIQEEKKNLNYLNLSINQIMNRMKSLQEISTKQIVDSKEKDQEIKNLKEENDKLHQTLPEINKEMAELKSLFYDNMLVLANQQDTEQLKQEITKLYQILEENSTEFLALKKSIQQPKEVKVIQHIFNDTQIIKLDQMNLRLLSDEPFYTEPVYTSEGYRYRIKVYTRSTGINKLAIYFQLLRGDLDNALKWPFTKNVNITLRDKDQFFTRTTTNNNYLQLLDDSSFDKPSTEYNVAVGYKNFISHEELKQFIINNNLFITITIQ